MDLIYAFTPSLNRLSPFGNFPALGGFEASFPEDSPAVNYTCANIMYDVPAAMRLHHLRMVYTPPPILRTGGTAWESPRSWPDPLHLHHQSPLIYEVLHVYEQCCM